MNTYDLSIIQGETYSNTLVAYDTTGGYVNLSGFAVSGYIKSKYGDTSILTSLNAIITGAISGQVNVSIPATGTAALPINYAFYDIEARNTGTSAITKLFGGKVAIYPEITV